MSVLAVLLVLAVFVSMGSDNRLNGSGKKELTSLWKQYETAVKADRPQKRMALLEDIKSLAFSSRSAWDYYRACREFVEVGSMRNWKLRDSLEAEFVKEVAEYDEPVLNVMRMVERRSCPADSIMRYVRENSLRMSNVRNVDVYSNKALFPLSADLHGILFPLMGNDYEYALWLLLAARGNGYSEIAQEVLSRLVELTGESYPKRPFAQWIYTWNHIAGDEEERLETMRVLAEKYKGTAFSLLPRQYLMRETFRSLEKDKASSGDFLAFRDSLRMVEKERKGYRGEVEASIAEECDEFTSMLDELERKDVWISVEDGMIMMAMRNLDKVRLKVTGHGSAVCDTLVNNPVRSFYAVDSLSLMLPVHDDGDYEITCHDGKDKLAECRYEKYRISLACRESADGPAVFAADYKSGKPVDEVDLKLFKGYEMLLREERFMQIGFTPMPHEMVTVLTSDPRRSGYQIQCETLDADGYRMLSKKVYVTSKDFPEENIRTSRNAVIMKDRSAFNPGDTVRFKAVVYDAATDGTMAVSKEGTEVVVKLVDTQGKEQGYMDLHLNAYGSVSGMFVLPYSARNGMFQLVVYCDAKRIGSSSLRVDEFILPDYDLVFDESDRVCLPGDTIKVSGSVRSYSGHTLSAAKIRAQILKDGHVINEEDVQPGAEGTFEIAFLADCGEDAGYAGYEVRIRITDATGETLEFSHYEAVSRHVNLDVRLKHHAEGRVRWTEGKVNRRQSVILTDDKAEFMMNILRHGGGTAKGDICYELRGGENLIHEGSVKSGDELVLDMSDLASGLYSFVAKCSLSDGYGRETKAERAIEILRMREDDVSLDAEVESVICVASGDAPSVLVGAGDGPVWTVMELFDDKGHLLESRVVSLDGNVGRDGSLVKVNFDYKDSYPDGVRLNVFYFRDGRSSFWTRVWRRPVKDDSISMEISRFVDKAYPSSEYSVGISATPGVELLAAVFDLSTEKIMQNKWNPVWRTEAPVAAVDVKAVCGSESSIYLLEMSHMSQKNMSFARSEETSDSIGSLGRYEVADESVAASDIPVREDFSTTLAFEPCLYPSEDGCLDLTFNTSDKLSTYVVSLFAHDKVMNTSVLRKEMLVSLPLKVSVREPRYLHEGDKYVMKVSVSNDSEFAIDGSAVLEIYSGRNHKGMNPMNSFVRELSVKAGETEVVEFEMEVPALDTLGFKVAFQGSEVAGPSRNSVVSDAVFVTVPVFGSEQTLVEAHSAVLLPGASEEDVLEAIRKSFVNVSSVGAEYSEISIMDMLSEALPLTVEAGGRDVISHSEAMYVNLLAASLRHVSQSVGEEKPTVGDYVSAAMTSVKKIISCANEDGGLGWFEGMRSSPVVTAVVLERFAGLRDRKILGLVLDEKGEDALDDLNAVVSNAVKYLDESFFLTSTRPIWCGGLTLIQYLNVRSMYAGLSFDAEAAKNAVGTKQWRGFLKDVKEILVPDKGRIWTQGTVLAKVRMIRILRELTSSESGRELALAWGMKNVGRMLRTIDDELVSLKEYAVSHPSGGVYYPNAVLPWRGLLETETYAHAAICDLFKDFSDNQEYADIAEGIRIWLMLQKETQNWEGDPGFIEAMASVYDGSDEVMNTKVVVLRKGYLKPFDEIREAGNGMSVKVRYYKEQTASGDPGKFTRVALNDGDELEVGDKIIAEYSLWSAENRSFVCLSIPRAALFHPVRQLSGWSGGWLRPLSYGPLRISPYCYREVKTDRTLYWVDVFPEENTSLEEELFVTQKGVFVTPAAEIECLYAPHYRANDNGGRIFVAK